MTGAQRYAVFVWEDYEASGGWDDLLCLTPSLRVALFIALSHADEWTSAHVVDLQEVREVWPDGMYRPQYERWCEQNADLVKAARGRDPK